MISSLLKSLKPGGLAPRVVLLPDAMFFVRPIAVSPGSTPADVSTQVELALENLSPFPPAQLYHGYFWTPGSERALVFAAYRRRFTTEQVDEWGQAELVLPSFAALLGAEVAPGTTILSPAGEGLTAVHWDGGSVPASVQWMPIPPNAGEADRAVVRDALIRATGGSTKVIELAEEPRAVSSRNERELNFVAADFSSRVAATHTSALDVRDKADLAALRRARGRDLILWRVLLGCVAVLGLLVIGELALVGGHLWQKTRVTQMNAQRPVVQRIQTAQNLTTHIKELSTKRLLPFEMIDLVSAKKPEAVTFVRTTTNGLYNLSVDAESTSPAAVSAYQAALTGQPFAERVEVRDQRSRDNVMTFTLVVTFRPQNITPAAGKAAP